MIGNVVTSKASIVAVFKNGRKIRYTIAILPDLLNNPDVDYVYNEQTGEVY